ncbi:MAG: bifunctional oligoribonuclease/PAP phosphatase NrnA [Turneriella sp.]|nr:bifunctional oligoribonuclease/PAP phosphatase NrnA [Turneriella sp.]
MVAEKETQNISAATAKSLLKSYRPTAKVLPKIAGLIKANKKFLLTTHIGADADGLGSQIGLYQLLKALKKDVKILNNERVPGYLKDLMPANLVNFIGDEGLSEAQAEKLMRDRFVFILDSSEPHRSDKVGEMFLRLNRPWATIDHHVLPGKKEFCVDPTYAATAELVWDLYKFMKKPIPKAAATPLYTGLVADSGNFRYPKTSLRTHLAAGELIGYGVHSDFIFRAIYESHPLDRLKLNARLMPKVQILANKVVVLPVERSAREGLDLGDSGTEGIVNHLLAHKGVKAAAVLSESEEGELKGSLRSIGAVDVASLAKQFGGGGHKNAAGLKIRKPFAEALKLIIAELEKL